MALGLYRSVNGVERRHPIWLGYYGCPETHGNPPGHGDLRDPGCLDVHGSPPETGSCDGPVNRGVLEMGSESASSLPLECSCGNHRWSLMSRWKNRSHRHYCLLPVHA